MTNGLSVSFQVVRRLAIRPGSTRSPPKMALLCLCQKLKDAVCEKSIPIIAEFDLVVSALYYRNTLVSKDVVRSQEEKYTKI